MSAKDLLSEARAAAYAKEKLELESSTDEHKRARARVLDLVVNDAPVEEIEKAVRAVRSSPGNDNAAIGGPLVELLASTDNIDPEYFIALDAAVESFEAETDAAAETPEVRLRDARAKLAEARKLVADGKNLGQVRAAIEAARTAAGCGRPDLVLGVRPLGADDLFAPLPPIEWLCRELHLGPGRCNLLVGYSGSAKSLAALSLCVAIASGRPFLGQFTTGLPKRVRYLSADSGTRAAKGRTQRLARGMGVTCQELRGHLEIIPRPVVKLTDEGALAAYLNAAEGVDLLVLDALRGFVPGVDENDSRIRDYIDLLTEVSERVGCTVLLVHHEGKSNGTRGSRPDDEAGRGSAGIQDGAGAAMRIIREDSHEAFLVKLSKPAEEPPCRVEPFYFKISDTHNGGLALEFRTSEQVNPPSRPGDRLEADLAHAKAWIAMENHQGRGVTAEGLAAGLGIHDKKAKTFRTLLEERGTITNRPIWDRGTKPRWWLTELAPPPASPECDEKQ